MGDPQTIASRDVLQTLLAEIAETDPGLLPPHFPKEKGDKSLGFLEDEYIQRVFSLSSFYRRESKRLQIDLEASGDDPLKSITFNQLKQKHETLQEIFWLLLRTHMDKWEMGMGIRKDWEVVNTDDAKSPGLPSLLRKLFEE